MFPVAISGKFQAKVSRKKEEEERTIDAFAIQGCSNLRNSERAQILSSERFATQEPAMSMEGRELAD